MVRNEQERPVDCRRLKELAQSVIAAEARRCGAGCHPECELNVVIGDDRWIQELNRKYRKRDAPTDVLAFPQEPRPAGSIAAETSGAEEEREGGAAGLLLGDVAISGEAAARQAEALGHGFQEEVAILVVHGILHLTGWRDETPAERQEMMRRVEEVLGEGPAGGRLPQGRDR